MSNNAGSGRAKVAARKLLNHDSIASNSTEYTNVEFDPRHISFIFAYKLPFQIPQVPSLFHIELRIERTLFASRGSSHT